LKTAVGLNVLSDKQSKLMDKSNETKKSNRMIDGYEILELAPMRRI